MTVKLVSFCRLFDAFSIPSLMDSISLNENLILHPNICLKSALFGEFIFNYMMKHLKEGLVQTQNSSKCYAS